MRRTWINRGHEHDQTLHASLLTRLKELQTFGDYTAFEHEHIRDLRPRVAAFEQQEAQKTMRAYQKGPHTKRALADALVTIAELAGKPLHRYFEAPQASGETIPYTPADEARKEMRDIITSGLATLKAKFPIITNRPQTTIDDTLRYAKRWWLVSPVDGIDDADVSISIALIDHGKPIAGIVHFPKLNRTYAGTPGEDGFSFVKINNRTRKIHTKLREDFRRVAATSHNERATGAFQDLRRSHHIKRVFAETSAPYGLCRLAQGSMDIYLQTGHLSQASIAASHAIVTAAGGTLTGKDGQTIRYGAAQDRALATPPFVAASDEKALIIRHTKRLVA